MESKKIEDALYLYLREKNLPNLSLASAMFDMDGVLFDSMKNHARCWHETMVHFGMNMSLEEAYMYEGRTGASTINIVSTRERGYESTPEEIEMIYGYKSKLFNLCPEAPRMPGAYELLKQVVDSGIIPLVVTGSGQKSLIERLNHNFPGIFHPDLMVTAFDVKYGKPHPEPYLMGLQKAGNLSSSQSIVIENAPLGVKAGVASGCFTIAVNTGPLPDSVLLEQGANLLFKSMQELSDSWPLLFEIFNRVKA